MTQTKKNDHTWFDEKDRVKRDWIGLEIQRPSSLTID